MRTINLIIDTIISNVNSIGLISDTWILYDGFWNDEGCWDDNAFWND